jgi:TolA-binding protein
MELKDFKAAQEYFSRSRGSHSEGSEFSINSILREADAVFMQKQYAEAERLYNKVIAANGAEADYARFQKAILLGLQRKNAEKTALLNTLISSNPPSAYATDARYEMALALIEEDKYQQAIATLMPLTEAYDRRNMAPKAWMKIGFANQQLNNNDKAIEAYRHIVVEYPTSDERSTALDALRSLYVQGNRPDEYAKLLKDNNLSPDELSLDSAYYSAAETQLGSGKWADAKIALTQYLKQYPNGAFALKAHYYKAESHYQLKEPKEALPDYDYVLAAPWSDFSENSARRAASIAYQNKDYSAAANYYAHLRNHAMGQDNLTIAYNGLMLSNYNLQKYEQAAAYADTLMSIPGIDAQYITEGQLHKARSLTGLNKNDDALLIYKQTSKKPAIVLEANYHIAASYYSQDKIKEAEEYAGKALQGSGSEFWMVKSYMLMSDILVKQKDYFNAKATLQSIIKNVKIPELKQEAAKKLEDVKALEKKQSKLSD